MRGAELYYPIMEKVVRPLVIGVRKLQPYFQAQLIQVGTDHPLKMVLSKPDHSRRLLKKDVKLNEFDTTYIPRIAIKSQALEDFLIDFIASNDGKRWSPKKASTGLCSSMDPQGSKE